MIQSIHSDELTEDSNLPYAVLLPCLDMIAEFDVEFVLRYDDESNLLLTAEILCGGRASIQDIDDFTFLLNSESHHYMNMQFEIEDQVRNNQST